MFNDVSHVVARWIDGLSLGAIVASLLGWLPHIAAGMSVVWVGLRISNEILERKIKRQEYTINARKLAGDD